MKLRVYYDPTSEDAFNMSDGLWLPWLLKIIENVGNYNNGQEYGFTVGSELAIHALRVIIMRGIISKEDVVIYFNDEVVEWDKKNVCTFASYPKGFCDHFEKFLMELF